MLLLTFPLQKQWMFLDYSAKREVPTVVCTTGLSEEQLAHLEETSKKVAILKSANMSLGINTLLKLIQDAAKFLQRQVSTWRLWRNIIILKWTLQVTALALADSLNEAMDGEYHYG